MLIIPGFLSLSRDVFIKHRIDDSIDSIYKNINGIQYKNWLYFILLKQNIKLQKNSYLQYVLEKTTKFEELKNNLLTGIIDVSHLDSRFETFYDERKRLVKDYSESEVAIFIHKNGIDPKESIYKYTDNTLIERKAILSWVSNYGWIEEINHIYPALADYINHSAACGIGLKNIPDGFRLFLNNDHFFIFIKGIAKK